MSVTYNIRIKALDLVDSGDIKSIVRRVHWDMVATDSDTELEGIVRNVDVFQIEDECVFDAGINQFITKPKEFDPSNFIDYNNLTAETVESWLESKLGSSVMERYKQTALNNLQEKISRGQSNSIATPLPWSS